MGNFKVIVVGAGPVGLIAAHALSKANIDFVVLEGRPTVVRDVGASLVLSPDSIRFLSQVGLLDRLRATGAELLTWSSYTAGGHRFNGDHVGDRWRASFGATVFAFHRAELLALLHEGLAPEDRARILLGKRVSGIEHKAEEEGHGGGGVVVTCEDGSAYEGDMVLGADGVHSRTRGFMRREILKADAEADVDGEVPFPIEYKTMWCSFPRRWEFPPGDHLITHGDTASLQFINATNRSWVFCYEKLDSSATTTTSSNGGRVKYTEADLEAYAAKHGETPIGDGRIKLKDVFAQRTSGAMADLEEGVLKHWSGGRIVLAGDACHKFTPNAGLGLNNGIQDVVVLVNELHRLLHSVGGGGGGGSGEGSAAAAAAARSLSHPSQEELTNAFTRYHEMRKEFVEVDFDFSRHTTRLQAWPNAVYWLLNRYVLCSIPGLNKIMWTRMLEPQVSKSRCLDFVEGEEPFHGAIPWTYPMPSPLTKSAA